MRPLRTIVSLLSGDRHHNPFPDNAKYAIKNTTKEITHNKSVHENAVTFGLIWRPSWLVLLKDSLIGCDAFECDVGGGLTRFGSGPNSVEGASFGFTSI